MVGRARLGVAVLALLQAVPLVLVLDGLEVAQEGPDGAEFGRLLNGTLREVLTGTCQLQHGGVVVLTSRFPFADVEGFDGDAARMLDVPAFTPAEGAGLLAVSGGGWLPEGERRELVAGVDGHALAVAALASVGDRPPTADLAGLRAELATAAGTNTRVAKVLNFYATRLPEADRYLVAAVALFARPVTPAAVLSVTGHEAFGGRLQGWTPGRVEAAARDRLAGPPSWHPDGTLSAHPLVRQAFRPLARARPRSPRTPPSPACPPERSPAARTGCAWSRPSSCCSPPTIGRPPTASTTTALPPETCGRTCRGPARATRRVGVRGDPEPPRRLRQIPRPRRLEPVPE